MPQLGGFRVSSKPLAEWEARYDPVTVEIQALPSAGKDQMTKRAFANFWEDTQGQDLVEYALAAGMVAVAAVAVMPTLTTVISNVFSKIGSIISSSVN